MLSQNSKIFITGGTGFLGGYIVRTLIKEGFHNLICLKRANSKIDPLLDVYKNVTWVEGDILDVPFICDVLKDIDVIIHAAAEVTFNPSDSKRMIQVAMEGTANLVNIALESDVSKFIHISSVAAIGRKKQDEDINEKMIFNHSKYDTTYGLSKFLAEQEVWRGHAEGLNITIISPSFILGAGQWDRSSAQIFKKVYRGMKYFPKGQTGWVDVRDVAKAVVLCVTEAQNGERFIISAENQTYQHIIEQIATNLGVIGPKKMLNKVIAELVCRTEAIKSFFTGSAPLFTKETILSTSVKSRFENYKSVEILRLTYRPVADTIVETSRLFNNTFPNGVNASILSD